MSKQTSPDSLHDLLVSRVPGLSVDDPGALSYVNHLTTLPLSVITSEPVNLSSEAAVLNSSLSNLCLNECGTFLSLHNTSSTIDSSLAAFEQGIKSLLELIPELEFASHEFQAKAKDIREERKETVLVMEQQEKLLDILELPQLVDTCVRNGYHQEALDLLNHTHKVASIYPDIDYVQEVKKEVEHAIQLMTTQLFNSLRGNVKLPAVFKTINFLRRLNVLSNDELALVFLSFRLEFLEEQLNYIMADIEDPAKCLKRYIDIWREGVNDIVMQHDTLFLKDSEAGSKDVPRELQAALLHRLLACLFHTLDNKLHLVIEANTIISLMTQLSFCSASFSKIGMDFRPLLVPLYEKTIVNIVNRALLCASHEFSSTIDHGAKEDQSPSLLFLADGSSLSEHVASTITAQTPPARLAEIPLFAKFLNSLISSLNNLRLLAPMNLMWELYGSYTDCLVTCIHALDKFSRNWQMQAKARLTEEKLQEEKAVLRVAGEAFLDLLVPFVRKALVQGVFSGTTETQVAKSKLRSEGDDRLQVAASGLREGFDDPR